MKRHLLLVIAGMLLFSACGKKKQDTLDDQTKEAIKATEETETLHISLNRYEQDLFKAKTIEDLLALQPTYPMLGDSADIKQNGMMVIGWTNDPYIKKLYNQTQQAFPNTDSLNQQLDKALTLYRYYFPEAKTPNAITYISGLDFEAPIKLFDTTIAIALDMYLGANSACYKIQEMPRYRALLCDKAYLLSDCMKELAYNHIADNSPNTLLEAMIFEGKRIYFAKAMLPQEADSLICGYKQADLDWLTAYEKNVWAYMIEHDFLFSNNRQVMAKFIGPAPFTTYFGNQSPARIGCWIGYRIVQNYMKNHPEVQLNELMNNTNARQLLNQSKYNPK